MTAFARAIDALIAQHPNGVPDPAAEEAIRMLVEARRAEDIETVDALALIAKLGRNDAIMAFAQAVVASDVLADLAADPANVEKWTAGEPGSYLDKAVLLGDAETRTVDEAVAVLVRPAVEGCAA